MWLSKRVHCFVLLLYLLPSPLDGKGYQWLERTDFIVTSQKLAGHVLWERHDVHTVLQCAMSCKRESLCESYNYYPEKNSCELNDGNREDHGRDMVAAPGVLYYGKSAYDIDPEAVGPCGAHPCKNGGRCVDVSSTSGERNFICMCPSGWTGRTCTDTRAPLVWSDWGDWSACTVTCGGGYQKRVRACVEHASGMVKSPFDCRGPEQEQQICGQTSCPRWTDWSEWGTCSTHVTCGYGQRVRSHTCTNGGIPGAERGCRGDVNQTSVCREPGCDMPLKLVGGASVGEGRLLVYDDISTTWGSICPDGWNKMAASLVCIQLGFWQGAHAALTDDSLGSGDEPYYLSDVTCKGGESSLQRCHHTGWRDVTCSSAKHAAVQCIVDGSWGAWSVWGECSATCAEGHRTRTRTCSHPPSLRGGKLCEGEDVQHKDCVEEPCPVDAHWRPWSEWSTCDLECGGGTQQRDRSCQEGKYGGASCAGASEETRDCNTQKCPIDGVWQEWTAWDECSVTCENGTQHRTRVCTPPLHDGQDCHGESSESQTCWEGPCPVDGSWLAWSEWTSCNKTCGTGYRKRARACTLPVNGGQTCQGPREEWHECNTQSCSEDGYWKDWGTWSQCSVPCGGGISLRSRECMPPLHGGQDCQGDAEEQKDCNPQPCPVDGSWSEWGEWVVCDVTCGGGRHNRSRHCNPPQYGGQPCDGITEQWKDCGTIPCPLDGVWNIWSEWSACNKTCGGGWRTRQRSCNAPLYGGLGCEGDPLDHEQCNTHICPDGEWMDWMTWSVCNISCGGGMRVRHRECIIPQHGGQNCSGSDEQEEDCNTEGCSVDGVWAEWSDWGGCSRTCGGGTRNRTRTCEGTLHGGQECAGDSSQQDTCGTVTCFAPRPWLTWEAWGPCSLTCGGGMRMRHRQCDPSDLGTEVADECTGDNNEAAQCHTWNCDEKGSTCAELREWGLVDNVRAEIAPTGQDVYWVSCNLTQIEGQTGVQTVTVIEHDQMGSILVDGFEDPGHYQHILQYSMEMEDIIAVVAASSECHQFIQWDCYSAALSNQDSEEPITFWFNPAGEQRLYWGDVPQQYITEHMCPCGVAGTCAKEHTVCNCDANDQEWRQDGGYLSHKEDLPVSAIHAGDTGSTALEDNEKGYYTVGPLQCW